MNQVKIEEIANKLGRITRFEMSFVNIPSSQVGQEIEKAVGYIRTDEETVALLQQNIPRILNSRKYFDAYAEKIAELYHFIVDKEHLRKKLKLFFDNIIQSPMSISTSIHRQDTKNAKMKQFFHFPCGAW